MNQGLFVRDRLTWLAYFALATYAYLQAALGPLMPFLRAELNLSYTIAGFHFSAFALGMIGAGLAADVAARRYSRRLVFWFGAGGMAAGALALVFARQVAFSIGSVFVMGLLGSLLLVMIQAVLADHHGPRRAIALTESNVMASIFASIVPLLIGGFQRAGIGWRAALVLAALNFLLLYVLFRGVTIGDDRVGDGGTPAARRRLPTLFWFYWLVLFFGVAIEWSILFWSADYLETVVGLTKASAAMAVSIMLGAMVIGRIGGSRLVHRWPAQRLLPAAVLVAFAGFLLFWLLPVPPAALSGLFIAGLGVANLFPLALSVATEVAADRLDTASARLSLAGGLAILLAPLALGGIADQQGIQIAFALVALLLLLATAITLSANKVVASQA